MIQKHRESLLRRLRIVALISSITYAAPGWTESTPTAPPEPQLISFGIVTKIIVGSVSAAIFIHIGVPIFMGWRSDKKKRKDLIRIFHADIKYQVSTFDTIKLIEDAITKMDSNTEVGDLSKDPVFTYSESLMTKFTIDYNPEIHHLPDDVIEPVLSFYAVFHECDEGCDSFYTDRFEKQTADRRKTAYNSWVKQLKDAKEKGELALQSLKKYHAS